MARSRRDRLGDSLTALCGGALALSLLLIVAILALIGFQGLRYFWQAKLVQVEVQDGRKLLGEVHQVELISTDERVAAGASRERFQLKVGNRDLVGADFVWVNRADVVKTSAPRDALVLERLEWGNFYGYPVELRRAGAVIATGSEPVWQALQPLLRQKAGERDQLRSLERGAIGDVNFAIERLRLAKKKLGLAGLPESERALKASDLDRRTAEREDEYKTLADRLFKMREALLAETLVVEAADGARKEVAVGAIARAFRPNAMNPWETARLYGSRAWEFVAGDPRESNTEGGIFPAIFGTVMMVFLMAFAVVPLGVLAALYLREYAQQGPLVRTVRIAVNNLAGVPSIVFGVFGLGFFVYIVGGTIDKLFYAESLPTPTFGTGGILWAALTLAILTVPVVIVATEEGLAAVPRVVREGSLALGATKFETIWRVVLPAAAPGILTGVILAMARAAGEVAPLMIVGMVKLAPTLPLDHHFPFVHFERKFMHLGFHIFDVGFQSPNVDATKPLVFATAFLLIVAVTMLNLIAIGLRNHLRRKYAGSAV
ncbi:MAG: phosphate ABC transporter permease PstA [Acidobacteriota bacterium]